MYNITNEWIVENFGDDYSLYEDSHNKMAKDKDGNKYYIFFKEKMLLLDEYFYLYDTGKDVSELFIKSKRGEVMDGMKVNIDMGAFELVELKELPSNCGFLESNGDLFFKWHYNKDNNGSYDCLKASTLCAYTFPGAYKVLPVDVTVKVSPSTIVK